MVFLWMAVLAAILAAGVFGKPSYKKDTQKYFSPKFLSRAYEYNRHMLGIYVIGRLIMPIYGFILFFLAGQYLDENFIAPARAGAIIALFLLVTYFINFPISYWKNFKTEKRFGLSNQSFKGWLWDYLKGFFLVFIIGSFGLTGLYAIIYYFPQTWWILAFLAMAAFIFLANILYPLLVAPLFYRFKPLDDASMVQSIKRMAEEAGIKVKNVLIADASTRTRKANAYFSGMGRTKRIVLFDTLINRFDKEETLAVVAHEIGHWKKKHIFKLSSVSFAAIFIFFFLLGIFSENIGGEGFRIIIVIFILYGLLGPILMPAENWLSRRFERESDNISLGLTQNPDYFIKLFTKLAKTNLSDVDPSPWVKYVLYSHPPIMERIGEAKKARHFKG